MSWWKWEDEEAYIRGIYKEGEGEICILNWSKSQERMDDGSGLVNLFIGENHMKKEEDGVGGFDCKTRISCGSME